MKKLVFSLVLLLFMVSAKAQDKYEFAKMTYVQNPMGGPGTPSRLVITIAKEDAEFEIIKLDKSEVAKLDYLDSSPFLKRLKKMREEGWEVYHLDGNGFGDVAYLRRKKP